MKYKSQSLTRMSFCSFLLQKLNYVILFLFCLAKILFSIKLPFLYDNSKKNFIFQILNSLKKILEFCGTSHMWLEFGNGDMHVILNLVLYVIHVFAHVESKNNIEWNSRSNVYSSNRGSCLKYAEIYKYIELEVYIYTRRFSY